jgi:putative addiction module killer protein
MGSATEKIIEEYKTTNGKSPFGEWLDSLRDKRAQVLIFTRLDRLKMGLLGATRNVGEGVHEIKIDYGSGYRVYFGNDGERVVILLVGGTKNTQPSDIQKAKIYWDDYKIRKTSEGIRHGKK